MNRESEHPSRDELLVMAYVDDELVAEQRELLEQRLVEEPELLRQVAAYQKLEVLARHSAPPEPTDLEWERILDSSLHQAGSRTGWTLLCAGLIGLFALGCIATLQSDLETVTKALILAPLCGFSVLLSIRYRDRQRLIPFDPYTEVKR
jgi:anti-sigma factor RsiW